MYIIDWIFIKINVKPHEVKIKTREKSIQRYMRSQPGLPNLIPGLFIALATVLYWRILSFLKLIICGTNYRTLKSNHCKYELKEGFLI